MQNQDKIRISVQDIEKSMLDCQKRSYVDAAQPNANLLSGITEKKLAVTETMTNSLKFKKQNSQQ